MKPDRDDTYDPEQVYYPEADTYLLLDAALQEVRQGDRVLEIGTGSGCIARALMEITDVIATDINPHAACQAKRNGVDIVRTDLFDGIRGQFDLVIFNPPYLPTKPGERIDDWLEYALDGGFSGRVVIERFAVEVGRALAPGGRVLLLVSSLTGINEVSGIFKDLGYHAEIAATRKVFDEELVVIRCNR